MPTQVIMPQLGESVVEGTITKWLKSRGDAIKELEPLLEINTDKVDTEIPSPASGTLLDVLVPEGTLVHAGALLAWIGSEEEAVPESAEANVHSVAAVSPVNAAISPVKAVAVPAFESRIDLGFISPVVSKIALEHHVDLSKVHGTGQAGRITKKDVLAYLEQVGRAPAAVRAGTPTVPPGIEALPTGEAIQPKPAGPPSIETGDELLPLSPVRRAIAEHMVFSERTSPHVTTVMETDLSRVVAHRGANKAAFERDGANLTFTVYFVSAVVAALKACPQVNSSWSEQGILIHRQINIGMAVSLGEEGLIVPVIKHADGLSLLGLARQINDLANRARLHKLQPDEVKGGTFTITNHGTTGSLFATPIINQPQCAILGVGAVQKRVVVLDEGLLKDAIVVRPMVYLTLTFDHRILDGASADNFLSKVVKSLENWG
jgi:pyruvate/2-oxoglutarate dehydrogenase complex dihydrolipoamide acyltransferase (E2) component